MGTWVILDFMELKIVYTYRTYSKVSIAHFHQSYAVHDEYLPFRPVLYITISVISRYITSSNEPRDEHLHTLDELTTTCAPVVNVRKNCAIRPVNRPTDSQNQSVPVFRRVY